MKKRNYITNPIILGILLSILFSLSACKEIHFDNKVRVNGVLLANKRTIQIRDAKNYEKFNADIHHGNIELNGNSIYDLEVEIYEKTTDDVTLFFDNGILTGNTQSGKPFAIGSIKGTIPDNIKITIDCGAGNFQLTDFTGSKVDLDLGAGNVEIHNCHIEKIIFDNGAGNFHITNVRAESIDIDTGAGNIKFDEVISRCIDCDLGAGNISATDCAAHNVYLDTGIGNISISDCQFKEKDISTGLGRVKGLKEKEEPKDEEVY